MYCVQFSFFVRPLEEEVDLYGLNKSLDKEDKERMKEGCYKTEMVKRRTNRNWTDVIWQRLQQEENTPVTLADQVNTNNIIILGNARDLIISSEVRSWIYWVLGSDLKFSNNAGVSESNVLYGYNCCWKKQIQSLAK